MLTEEHLISNFLNSRNENDFLALYNRHTAILYQTAIRLSGQDEFIAQEMVQEMWVIAVQKLPQFKGLSTLRTWLTGILINLFRERFRNESKYQQFKQVYRSESKSKKIDKDKQVESIDLENAIASLPDGYRQIMVLHDVEGYTHQEISEYLEISEGTSKSQLFKARKAVRAYLNDELKEGTHGQ